MIVINWIIQNILTQASIIIGLVSLVGLAVQKKPVSEIITGTLKTMLGFLVLGAGSSVITGSLTYFGEMFSEAFNTRGIVPSIEAINGQAINDLGLGSAISLTFLGIFIANIIIARFTKWKYIFLTGQAILWMATMTTIGGHYIGLSGWTLIIVGALGGGIFAVGMPAIAQPIVRRITGSDDIALGHFCTIGYLFAAGMAYLFGEKGEEKSSLEDIEISSSFDFLQDSYVSMMIVMVPVYIVTAIFAGPEISLEFSNQNYIIFAFLQAMQFVVGLYILLSGVRLMLDELIPAFRGIAMKIVPDSKPALDIPVLFPYSPNSVIVGFLTTTIGSVIAMFVLPLFGLPVILPGMMTNFFAGGGAGIFANETGGRRGAIIGGILHGIFITLLSALLVGVFDQVGFVNATATDSDTIVALLIYAVIGNLFGLA